MATQRSRGFSRYFFDTVDTSVVQDSDGVELEGPGQARSYAIMLAGQCLVDDPAILEDGGNFRVEVRDEHGLSLYSILTILTESPAVGRT